MEFRRSAPDVKLIGIGAMLTGALLLTTTGLALPLNNQSNGTQIAVAVTALAFQLVGAGILLFAHARLGLSVGELLLAEFSWGGGASGLATLLLGEGRQWETMAIGQWVSALATAYIVWTGSKRLEERQRHEALSLPEYARPLVP